MTSFLSSHVLPLYLRLSRANLPYGTRQDALRTVERLALRPRPFGPPRRLRRDVVVTPSRRGNWPLFTITPAHGGARGAVVYAHGGGWVGEIAVQHWHLCAQLAAEAGVTVVLPIYPLVPHGTAQEVVTTFVDIVEETTAMHGPTCIAGDSAGGQVAMSTRLMMRESPAPDPVRTILIAPALDLSMTNPEMDVVQPSDPWLAKEGTRVYIELWRADLPLDDPRVSPLAADPAGTGPITLFIGGRDILHPDSLRFVQRCRDAGVEIQLFEEPGCVHVHPLTPTPEGRRGRRQIVQAVREAVSRAG